MQDSNTLKGVLFDMDGTLFGTEEIWYQSELKLMTRFGVHWNRADHAYCVGGPMPRVTNYMLDKLDNKISAEELFSFEMEYIEREFASNPIPWQPGAQELVLEVVDKGIKIALVTASSKHLVNLVNAQINLDIFDTVVCGDDVISPKPSPDAYLLAMAKLGLNSKNSMAIEDSNSGVRSALAADLHVLCPPSHQIIVSDDKLKLIETLVGIGVNDLEFWNWK
jgi:HAD superfamily hydrolase (TIGR01509 family)